MGSIRSDCADSRVHGASTAVRRATTKASSSKNTRMAPKPTRTVVHATSAQGIRTVFRGRCGSWWSRVLRSRAQLVTRDEC